MNKWESSYAQYLELIRQTGAIQWWEFEPVKLRLAQGCYYIPDFWVLRTDGVYEFHEVKGHWRDDALVKFKVAASQFPFTFIAKSLKAGGWEVVKCIDGAEQLRQAGKL